MLFDNMTFNPAAAGWIAGQQISVLCVGGGGGGGGGAYTAGGQAGWGGKTVNNGNNYTNLRGGGGGAGYGAGGGGGASGGRGGNNGSVVQTTFVLQNMNNIAVTIGARGAGGGAANGAGGNGGTTSFGTILSANGGTGGAGGTSLSTPGYGGKGGYIPFMDRIANKLYNSANASSRNVNIGLNGLEGGQMWVNNIYHPVGLGGEGGMFISNNTIGNEAFDGGTGRCFPSCDSAGLGVIILEW